MTASDRNHVKKSGAWVLRAGRDPTSPAEPNEESLWPGDGPRGPVPRGRGTTENCRRTPIGVLTDPLKVAGRAIDEGSTDLADPALRVGLVHATTGLAPSLGGCLSLSSRKTSHR